MSRLPPKVPGRTARRPRLPGLHGASITGRARADRGPLLLAGAVVVLATLLVSAVPPIARATADDAVTDAVVRAGARAAVVVSAPFDPEDGTQPRTRQSRTAEVVETYINIAKYRLGPALTPALRPPVAQVTTAPLKVVNDNLPGRTIRLTYVAAAGGGGPGVVWTAGGPPAAAVPAARADTTVGPDPTQWSVQVGLSQQTATALAVGPGDQVLVRNTANQQLDVRVSGVFRPVDAGHPVWQVAPQLLRPDVGSDGLVTNTEMAALLSKDSLPDARLVVDPDKVRCTVTFTPDPRTLSWRKAESLAAAVVALKASSGSSLDTSIKWESGLDLVLRDARAQVAAASVQASVVLVGLVVTAALVLLLAADLLVRRRAVVLAGSRMRGASLAGIGAELVVESSAVALAGGAVGLLLALLLADGSAWLWAVPVLLVAVLGGPVFGTRLAARATSGRRAPANRSARRSALRTVQLRRVALEVAVVLAATGAFVALRQRGVVPAGPDEGTVNALPAIAPTLGAVTGALVLLRLLPPGVDLVLRRATRSRHSLALLGAARAAATAARPLPFLVLVMSSALMTFALSVSATESNGQAQGAWRAVGADARLEVRPSPGLETLARRVAATDGVRLAVAARVADTVPVVADSTTYARLVVVDPAMFRQLLAGTPLPDAPQLSRLEAPGGAGTTGGRVPALVRSSDPALRQAKELSVRWNDTLIGLTPVGPAPAVGDGEGDVVVVDATAFAAAGAVAEPNTVWAVGPRAAQALTAAAGGGDVVTLRQDVLTARREAPLAAGLLQLANASTGVLLLLGLLGVALGAAASAPGRGETLARLRTLGLRPGEARQVAAGELLPPVVVGAVGGLAIGVLLAHASLGLLGLRLLTGQVTEPVLVVPWVTVVPVVLLLVAVAVVVEVESSLSRRERLGQVLRAGNG
jgi:putative ABC transport system permease protein